MTSLRSCGLPSPAGFPRCDLRTGRPAGRQRRRDPSPRRCRPRGRESSDSTMDFCTLGSTSSRASAATSSSRVSNTASRSSGARSSTMSAMSAGCSLASRSCEIFSFTRRAGSVSITSTKSQGMIARRDCAAAERAARPHRNHALEQPPNRAACADVDAANFEQGMAVAPSPDESPRR